MEVMEQVRRLQADDPVAVWAIIAAAAVLLLMILVWLIRRRRPVARDETPEIAFIDVGSLPAGGPPAGGTQLELYGTPVRLRWWLLPLPADTESFLPQIRFRNCWNK